MALFHNVISCDYSHNRTASDGAVFIPMPIEIRNKHILKWDYIVVLSAITLSHCHSRWASPSVQFMYT